MGRTEAFEPQTFGIKSLLANCPTEMPTDEHRKTCARIFTAALFIMTITWKQPKYPSTVEWIQPWYLHSMEYSTAMEVNSLPLYGTDLDYSYSVELMKPDTKEYILQNSIFKKWAEFWYWLYILTMILILIVIFMVLTYSHHVHGIGIYIYIYISSGRWLVKERGPRGDRPCWVLSMLFLWVLVPYLWRRGTANTYLTGLLGLNVTIHGMQ